MPGAIPTGLPVSKYHRKIQPHGFEESGAAPDQESADDTSFCWPIAIIEKLWGF